MMHVTTNFSAYGCALSGWSGRGSSGSEITVTGTSTHIRLANQLTYGDMGSFLNVLSGATYGEANSQAAAPQAQATVTVEEYLTWTQHTGRS